MNHAYTVKLEDIGYGRPFMMVNYKGVYIRVQSFSKNLFIQGAMGQYSDFNDDGFHIPIVELGTGHLMHMWKGKPCFLYPGESYRE